MKFGIREVCDCKFYKYESGSPNMSKAHFEIDSAKTSTLESTSTTVYAQGGKGNARLAAWEGEKTLTFTVEDALLTTESLSALVGNDFIGDILTITTEDYAGYYYIEAKTLARDISDGTDKAATIIIPKAKLQSNLNIPMTPSGDPAAFTFTFDAFPVDKVLCQIKIDEAGTTSGSSDVTIVYFNGIPYSIQSPNPELHLDDNSLNITLMEGGGSEEDSVVITKLQQNQLFTNGASYLKGSSGTNHNLCPLIPGSISYWYVI